MKKTIFCLALLQVSAGLASNRYTNLTGKWSGRVEKNIRNKSEGGNPSEGEVGTPVIIQLRESPKDKGSIEGESRLGKVSETWEIKDDAYIWRDETIEVSTKAVPYAEIPAWIKEDLNLKPTDQIFAFKFNKCVVNKTKEPCTPKRHLPDGMEKSAHWIFKTQGNQLTSSVLYLYNDGQKRVLSESLMKE